MPDDTGWPSTIAGVVGVLRSQAGFHPRHLARIEIAPLRLPSRDTVWSAHVAFEVDSDIRAYVSLRASTVFRALIAGESQYQTFDSTLLDGAIVNAAGHVSLEDGRDLRAVEVIPAITRHTPSTLDYIIIHCLIEFNNAESCCYENPLDHLPAALRNQHWGDLRTINFGRLQQLKIPPLKVLVGYIVRRCPGFRPPCEQKVADTLRVCGLRVPKLRPRTARRAALLPNSELDRGC